MSAFKKFNDPLNHEVYNTSVMTTIFTGIIIINTTVLVYAGILHPLWLASLSWAGFNLCLGFTLGKASARALSCKEYAVHMSEKWFRAYQFTHWSWRTKKLFFIPLVVPFIAALISIWVSFMSV